MLNVLVPNVPKVEQLIPFLKVADEARMYSNGGALAQRLEKKLGGAVVSSCTTGLELAIPHVFKRKKIRIPAFTFVATATAVIRAGYEPVFCDVDPYTWLMADIDEQSLPVCAFGNPVEGPLVDAASAWGNPMTSNRVYSMHATKVIPAGEGGLVCGDDSLLDHIRLSRNFGLQDGVSVVAGTNAKMSEYHCAVALAALDAFAVIDGRRKEMDARYRRNLEDVVQFQKRPVGTYNVFPILIRNAEMVRVELLKHKIETRRWYAPIMPNHPAFVKYECESLPNAIKLGDQILCLPFHTFMTDDDIDRVSELVKKCA